MDIEDRFIEVFELLENSGAISSRSDAADLFGYKKSTFTEILKKRTKVSPYLIQSFCKKYGVNVTYIMNGEGPMFIKPSNAVQQAPISYTQEARLIAQVREPELPAWSELVLQSHESVKAGGIPLVGQRAAAGFAACWADVEWRAELPLLYLPGMHNDGNLWAFEVIGDSMFPTIKPNDIVVARHLKHPDEIRDNAIHVLMTREAGFYVKRVVRRDKKDGTIRLISDNKSYRPVNIVAEAIEQVLYVTRVITGDLHGPMTYESRLNEMEQEMLELRTELATLKDKS